MNQNNFRKLKTTTFANSKCNEIAMNAMNQLKYLFTVHLHSLRNCQFIFPMQWNKSKLGHQKLSKSEKYIRIHLQRLAISHA